MNELVMKMAQAFFRTGFLHVPQMDAAAGEAISRTLIGALRRVVIQQESYAASDRRWPSAAIEDLPGDRAAFLPAGAFAPGHEHIAARVDGQ